MLLLNPIVLGWSTNEIIPKQNAPLVVESESLNNEAYVYAAREGPPLYCDYLQVWTTNFFTQSDTNPAPVLEKCSEYKQLLKLVNGSIGCLPFDDESQVLAEEVEILYGADSDPLLYEEYAHVLIAEACYAQTSEIVEPSPEKHHEYVHVYHEITPLRSAECNELREVSYSDCIDNSCPIERTTLFPLLTTFKYRGGKGRSYPEGFESGELFLAYHRPESRCYTFMDLKEHRVGEGKLAGNWVTGWRIFYATHEAMFVVNAYFGYSQIQNCAFHQLGLGMELLCKYWDIRANGYIPLANQRAFIDRVRYTYPNPAYSATAEEFERGMWGFDMEVGQHLCRSKCFEVYNAIGPYFYGSPYNTNSMVGAMGRIFVRYKQYLTLQFFITHDRNFRTLAQGEISITLPSPRSKRFRDCFYKPVERNNIILTEFFYSDWITNF